MFKWLLSTFVALFIVLTFAGLNSICANVDLKWLFGLVKSVFVPTASAMTVLVCIDYFCHIALFSRLIRRRFFLPDTLIALGEEILKVLYLCVMFRARNLYLAAVVSGAVFLLSVVALSRYFTKDCLSALSFLYSAAFNAYCFVVSTAFAIAN